MATKNRSTMMSIVVSEVSIGQSYVKETGSGFTGLADDQDLGGGGLRNRV
jgi:hypothetical protein